ncbi:asparagine synthetase B family protein [Actinomadura sp. 1N219]|uniref:asparagine synthetase B family protein n=1 Tax=Actinomadura sp. 1N219 TaxID=3375152 RepID=UPI0037AB3ACC
MGHTQDHRGPDGTRCAVSTDSRAVLAMNTLRIVNLDVPLGPYADPGSGLLLTFNGEIYNCQRVAADWGITLGAGESDAHLLLRAWARAGPACLEALDGMFAFAIYDPRSGTLFLARDRLGEKPLYWRLDGGRLAFASEVTTLTGYGAAPMVARPEMLAIETCTGVDTPFQGIQALAPATLLAFQVAAGSLDQRLWWDLARTTPAVPCSGEKRSYSELLAEFCGLLAEEIPLRAPAGDFALLLSGGLDSSVLAYLMRPSMCVTVRYPGQDRLDESRLATRVAHDINAELVIVEPDVRRFSRHLPDIARALDYPMGNASIFSEYMAYHAIHDLGLRVVIGGLGPDELLMGYVRHAMTLYGANAVLDAGLESYQPLAGKLMYPAGQELPVADQITRLVLRGPDPDSRINVLVSDALQRADGDIARAWTLVELATSWRPLVATSDKLASSFGLERRSPYLARSLVELSYWLPTSCKIDQPALGKRILRDAARLFGLPAEVWDNRDKLGFASPVPAWITGELRSFTDHRIAIALRGCPPSVQPLLEAGLASSEPYSRTRMVALLTAFWLATSSARIAA